MTYVTGQPIIFVGCIAAASEDTVGRIKWFMALEKHPRTLNEPYYLDYRARFLSHYKGWRPKDDQPRSSLTSRINAAFNGETAEPDLQNDINLILAGFSKIGLHSMQPNDLAKLLPPDPYDAAIDIMASVRAYFQGEHLCHLPRCLSGKSTGDVDVLQLPTNGSRTTSP